MGRYGSKSRKMKATKVTNVLKMVHGWQNDGYQKDLFYEDNQDNMCLAGCGAVEGRLHFVHCTAGQMKAGQRVCLGKFHKVHKKLKMAGIIYNSLLSILLYFKDGGEPPRFLQQYESSMDTMVEKAWKEQKLIGWDQILKGRISSKWGIVQAIFYGNNEETRAEKHFTLDVWNAKTIGSLLSFTLGLWNDRCDTLHGANEAEHKKIQKNNIIQQVVDMYENRRLVREEFQDMFF